MFKTRLDNNLHENPINFAGHYILVEFGCGTGCIYSGYIDANTGNAMELPFVVHLGLSYEYEPIEYKADSRLLIISGYCSEDDVTQKRYFFSLKNSKLEPICYTPLDDKINSKP